MSDGSPHVVGSGKPRKDNIKGKLPISIPTFGGVSAFRNIIDKPAVKWIIGVIVLVILVILITWLYKSAISSDGNDSEKELFDVPKRIAELNTKYAL